MTHTDAQPALMFQMVRLATAAFKEADTAPIHEAERLGRIGNGYMAAVNSLMMSVPNFRDEYIEHPEFLAARRLARSYSGL